MKFYNLSTYSIPIIWEQVFIVRYIPADGRIDSMVETDTHVFILEFKVDKSGRVASGRDF